MRIIVTGAGGYIGRYILPILSAEGHEVIAITRKSTGIDQPGISWKVADLCKFQEASNLIEKVKAEGLLHLAWYTEHGRFWNAPENFMWASATASLLQTFHRTGGRRAIICGTCAEYDGTHGYCIEDVTPTLPQTVYGKCKDATRQFVENFSQESGLEFAWARIFFPYGPGEPENRLLPSVLRAMIRGDVVLCSHGKQFRDFLHVSDVASALVHLLVRVGQSGVFNVASGEPLRIASLIKLCGTKFANPPALKFGAIAAPEHEPPMLVGKVEKLSASGWQPKMSIADGIDNYIEYLRTGSEPNPTRCQ